MRGPLHPCPLVTESGSSIVFRIVSKLSSQVQQEIDYIRPMVEERFAKMEEYGKDWDDKPVCQIIVSGISLIKIPRPIRRTICLCGSWARPEVWRGPSKASHGDCSWSILPP